MAEALQMQGDLQGALAQIDLALAFPESTYRSTYLHERFKIRVALADADARDDLERAILECKHPKFKRQLEAERDAQGK